jgi:hypothetical protein
MSSQASEMTIRAGVGIQIIVGATRSVTKRRIKREVQGIKKQRPLAEPLFHET